MKKQERPHFYYKVAVASEIGEKLTQFHNRCLDAEEEARKWVEAQGGANYYESPDGMAGGVVLVDFGKDVTDKPGWERVEVPVSAQDTNPIFVPCAGTPLEEEMFSLTIISERELIPILQFKPILTSQNIPLPFTFGDRTPVLFRHHENWYIDCPYESQAPDCHPIREGKFFRARLAALNTAK